MAQISNNQYYRRASFLISAGKPQQFPRDDGVEVAFAGRSNSGKSSAINALCGNKNLAKTSKTPGRTRLINFFTLDSHRRLVDLPGYGYAKVADKVKKEWELLLQAYLQQPDKPRGLVIIMDIRHPMTEFDRQMLAWCQYYGLPAHILLTKADKLKRGAQQARLLAVKKMLQESGSDATVQIFSALRQIGLDEFVVKLNEWLELG
ncbi:MAG: YihA family ribosome biogenesis GTP-binding protein [Gammaproteobacteria bacterium]|nr:YihA family ribosome biogenesis GTP-binding protein [Gammaproteobacteria bacterium]